MKDLIHTYRIGNGEITLTAQDAEELRRILQFEYIEGCIESIIDSNRNYFHFTSEHNRSAFVRKVAERYDDLVDVVGCHGECLDEDVFYDAEFSGFWKE